MTTLSVEDLLLRILLLGFDSKEVDPQNFLQLLDREVYLVEDGKPSDNSNEQESFHLIKDWLWVFPKQHVEAIESNEKPAENCGSAERHKELMGDI